MRVKVQPNTEAIQSWEQVDQALAEIAVLTSQIQSAEGKYNEQEQIARAKLTEKLTPARQRVEALADGLERFCQSQREAFGDRKSLEMQHGVVSFRLGNPKVSKNKKLTWDLVLDFIRNSDRADLFIRSKEEINKEAILQASAAGDITPDELAELGISVVQDETFGYELKLAAKE